MDDRGMDRWGRGGLGESSREDVLVVKKSKRKKSPLFIWERCCMWVRRQALLSHVVATGRGDRRTEAFC